MEPFDSLEIPKDDHKFTVAASLTHMTDEMQEVIQTIAPVETKRLGGSGNKCANLAMGKVDAYMHP
jgi:3'-phosphoadenosine 5'-phosphosulfate (PAPS) 3'-phosphatase